MDLEGTNKGKDLNLDNRWNKDGKDGMRDMSNNPTYGKR